MPDTEVMTWNDNTPNRFAYGDEVIDNCPCPAVAAGLRQNATHVAERYDTIVCENGTYTAYGTVDEQTAREAWMDTIAHFEKMAEKAKDEYDTEWTQKKIEVAKEIADELGW